MEANKKNMTVSEAIFEQLKERIVSGEWKPGEQIPSENKLCQLCGALAAQRADAEQIAAMHEATKKMAEATTTEEITQYDLEFHYLIMQGSRNSILVKVFEVLRDTYFSLLHENVERMGSTGAAYHQMITVAIESRDADLAKVLMEKHLNNTIRATVDLQESEVIGEVEAEKLKAVSQ